MKPIAPPKLPTSLLIFLLPERDRETISGDLYEEFIEVIVPERGKFRARVWYTQQVLSFVPRRAVPLIVRGPFLRLLCLFTALAGCWLGAMDLLLQHLGYRGQLAIASTIVIQALLTVAALRLQRFASLRTVAMIGSLSLLWIAGSALKATFEGAQFEGYVLLISLGLIIQAALTLLALRPTLRRRGKNA